MTTNIKGVDEFFDSVGAPLATGGGTVPGWFTLAPLLHVREEQANTTEGGGSTGGTQHVRVLNTVVENQIEGASLATNQVRLTAGTY